ncbi:MAG: radical SAM family heme chaperone HemW [Desulfovibrionaceae bacterium]|nr:radical SAM family heme chaperone HemW [Desulfovibrionaceae bacterium]
MVRIFGESPAKKKPAQKKAAAPPGEQGLLLYIHVPFCKSRCRYCSFHSQAFNQVTYAWYLKTLLMEIDIWGRRLQRPAVQTVFFGGGTPSLAPAHDLDRIMAALRQAFRLREDAEISLEANPDTVDAAYFRSLLAMGVNRLSIGVQSLADKDLALLGRTHSARQAVAAFGLARQAGFANIGLDLIWGLPGQRLRHWMDQLKTVTRLKAEHLSCYGLSLEPKTALAGMIKDQALRMPSDRELANMYVSGSEFLESQGYIQYEISNFARMGFFCRHNLGYWEGRDYLGLGPSAVSTIGPRRFTNPRYMDAYDAAVRGGFVGQDFEVLDKATKIREMVMLALRTTKGLDLREYARASGRDLVKSNQALVQELYKNNLIRIYKGRLRLTKNGMLVSDAIIARLAP